MLMPPSSWSVVTGTTTLYPTSGAGATSTTAGNSILITPTSTTSSFIQRLSQRRPNMRVFGYLVHTAPATDSVLTIESHDGTVSHATTIEAAATGIAAEWTFTQLGSGILIPGGLRFTLTVTGQVNVYWAIEN